MALSGMVFRVIGAKELARKLRTKYPTRMKSETVDAMKEAVSIVRAEATVLAPHQGGDLRRSIKTKVFTMGKDRIIGRIGTNKVYARIQEKGGVVRPKRSKYLTIPMDAAKTSAGKTKKPARRWKNTTVFKSKAGNLIIWEKVGNKVVPLFVLKKRVRIKASPFMAPALKNKRREIRRLFKTAVKKAVV